MLDRDDPKRAAKYFVIMNPDLVYLYMKGEREYFVTASERGFESIVYRTDMIFPLSELVK